MYILIYVWIELDIYYEALKPNEETGIFYEEALEEANVKKQNAITKIKADNPIPAAVQKTRAAQHMREQ